MPVATFMERLLLIVHNQCGYTVYQESITSASLLIRYILSHLIKDRSFQKYFWFSLYLMHTISKLTRILMHAYSVSRQLSDGMNYRTDFYALKLV